ncbi:unnamed protein product [Orchesella dallaii]|uniref:Uncharacterized protein n=1 Tax=Orchesella dallaii TaxID=48710 RepID=A0ABP1RGK9_9HEXA
MKAVFVALFALFAVASAGYLSAPILRAAPVAVATVPAYRAAPVLAAAPVAYGGLGGLSYGGLGGVSYGGIGGLGYGGALIG